MCIRNFSVVAGFLTRQYTFQYTSCMLRVTGGILGGTWKVYKALYVYFSIHQYTFPYTLCIRVHYISPYMPFHAELVDDKRAISSAKSRSSSFVLNFHLTPVFPSCNVFFITQSTTSRNSKPDMLQPCFTPVWILNHSVVS